MSTDIAPKIVEELRSSSALIDRATAAACRAIIARHETEWSAWEIERALGDLERLSNGGDCTYDRPSVGVSYALWYHGKRTHDALRILAPRIARVKGSLRIVDLGCGTGATACAVALVVGALQRCGASAITEIVIDGIDSSPFMVEVGREVFAALARECECTRVHATFDSTPWEAVARSDDDMITAIVGGYLLDHSDSARPDEIVQRLKVLSDRLGAKSILLSTAPGKRSQLTRVREALEREEWRSSRGDFALAADIAGDPLGACHTLRRDWYERHELAKRGLWRHPPAWSSNAAPASLAMRRERGPISPTLFGDERDAGLSDEAQEMAAKPDGRLTVIVGAAGSGKTIVLSKRIADTIRTARPADPAPVMLVTAFNKAVVNLIVDEMTGSLMVSEGVVQVHRKRGEGDHLLDVVIGGRTAHVEFMNRDKLPGRVFGVPSLGHRRSLRDEWTREIERRRDMLDAADRALVAGLGHAFLADEFERVVFGLRCLTLSDYQDVDRRGRVTPLARGRTREVTWRLLMEPSSIASHVNQRMLAYRSHEAAVTQARPATLAKRWTHVFVDECQDFTAPEIQLLARVPQDPRHLCVAVDASQSVHLGRSYHRPGITGAQWRTHLLEGSYRLPLRVCEALQPLARDIAARTWRRGWGTSSTPSCCGRVRRRSPVRGRSCWPALTRRTSSPASCARTSLRPRSSVCWPPTVAAAPAA